MNLIARLANLGSVLLAAASAGCTCATTHGLDGGARHAPSIDPVNLDAGYNAGCQFVGGYCRCDESCPLPRDDIANELCQPTYRICAWRASGPDFAGEIGGGCRFTPGRKLDKYCPSGQPCAALLPEFRSEYQGIFGNRTSCSFDSDAGPEQFCGLCFEPEFCLEARDAGGFPPFRCVWSDGSEVVGPIARGECPASLPGLTGNLGFCGGVYGDMGCAGMNSTNSECVGINERRPFGICNIDNIRCTTLDREWTRGYIEFYREVGWDVACMVTMPQPAGFPLSGFFVHAETCRVYRSFFPDSVDCVDGDWNSIP